MSKPQGGDRPLDETKGDEEQSKRLVPLKWGYRRFPGVGSELASQVGCPAGVRARLQSLSW